MNRPWEKWPAEYKEAIPQADFENLKTQLAEAEEQFKQAYRDQLFEFAMPLEEKAAEGFLLAVQESRNMSMYNDCAREALALLADKYKPSEFPRVTEYLAEVKAGAGVQDGNNLLTKVADPLENAEALSEGMLKAVANAVPVQTNAAQQASPQQNRAEDTAAAQSANDHEGADEEPEEPSGPDEDGLF